MSLTIGSRLKAAREAKKISLEEACRVTKIQRKTLEAIEQDQVEEILDPAYAKIFIKKYASYLGVDGSALTDEYLIGRPGNERRESPLSVQTEVTRVSGAGAQGRRILVAAFAGLVALVGIGFMGYLAVDLVGTLRQQKTAGPAKKPPAAEQAVEKRPPLVPLSKELKLTVATSDKVWLQVKADGAVIFQNVLPKGAKETWIARKELELWTGNAGAMQLSLNGKNLEGLGRGVKKGVKVTHLGLEP